MPLCSQAQCKIAETGVCLEGHKQGCPHLQPDQEAASAALTAPPSVTASPEPKRFHTGEKFAVGETSRVMNAWPTKVILCAGSQESGKTTFLARIGEMFRAGQFEQFKFAWSFTLCGFERTSWLATITSGVSRPKTKRTHRVENDKFLHLRVRRADDKSKKYDLLISDLAGETFPTAVSNKEFCVGLRALNACDQLVVFLDSKRLIDKVERHTERDNVTKFLQRVAEIKHNAKDLCVHVIFSRWDYVQQSKNHEVERKYCSGIESDITGKFSGVFADLKFHHIAARPEPGTPATDPEIRALFGYWIELPMHSSTIPTARNHLLARDFCAFGLK